MERQLEKYYLNLDCNPKDGDFTYIINLDRNILENANKYDVSVVSALINCRTPLMIIDKSSPFWINICVGYSNISEPYGKYKNIQTTNVQTLIYLLRDINYDYISKQYPNLFAIRYESFWTAINLAFNMIITQAPNIIGQVVYLSYKTDFTIFAPYINYISPTNIEFHINNSTSVERYGYFWSKEFADLLSKIFCSACEIVKVYDNLGNVLGYRNVFTKINSKIYAPTNKTVSYHSDTEWNISAKNSTSRLPVRSDVWPTGGCTPWLDNFYGAGLNKHWVFGNTVMYYGSNTKQLNIVDYRYTPGILPSLYIDKSGFLLTQSYNTFKLKTFLSIYTFKGVPVFTPNKQSFTNAGLAMLRDFKYEKLTIWYDAITQLVRKDELKYGPSLEDYLINLIDLGINVADKHILLSIFERDVIKSTKAMTDIVFPIERIDVVCNNKGAKTEYLLSNGNTSVQCSNILRSFIVDSRDISSDKLTVIYTPQSELIRTDME